MPKRLTAAVFPPLRW